MIHHALLNEFLMSSKLSGSATSKKLFVRRSVRRKTDLGRCDAIGISRVNRSEQLSVLLGLAEDVSKTSSRGFIWTIGNSNATFGTNPMPSFTNDRLGIALRKFSSIVFKGYSWNTSIKLPGINKRPQQALGRLLVVLQTSCCFWRAGPG